MSNVASKLTLLVVIDVYAEQPLNFFTLGKLKIVQLVSVLHLFKTGLSIPK